MANTTGKKWGGRVAGTPNKATTDIRERFRLLIENNADCLDSDLKALKPVDRVKAIIDLAKFCIPTLKSVDFVDTNPAEKEQIKIIFKK